MDYPIIETERLRLRGWNESDLDGFSKLNANAEFIAYLGGGVPIDRAESFKVMLSIIGHWTLLGYGLWLVEDKASGNFIGRIGLLNLEDWPAIELGWGIHPNNWGKGYATEAAIASADWAFTNLHLDSLISIIDPRNAGSKAVARRIGEKYDRTEFVKDRDCDIFKITKDDFYQKHKKGDSL